MKYDDVLTKDNWPDWINEFGVRGTCKHCQQEIIKSEKLLGWGWMRAFHPERKLAAWCPAEVTGNAQGSYHEAADVTEE